MDHNFYLTFKLCSTANFQRILKSKPVLENIEKNKLEKLFGLANFFFIRSPKKQLKTKKNAMTGKKRANF